MDNRMCAKLFVDELMSAFAEEMEIELAENCSWCLGIGGFSVRAF